MKVQNITLKGTSAALASEFRTVVKIFTVTNHKQAYETWVISNCLTFTPMCPKTKLF
jgi:hypothetical protein